MHLDGSVTKNATLKRAFDGIFQWYYCDVFVFMSNVKMDLASSYNNNVAIAAIFIRFRYIFSTFSH
jgi:hypothetical protein